MTLSGEGTEVLQLAQQHRPIVRTTGGWRRNDSTARSRALYAGKSVHVRGNGLSGHHAERAERDVSSVWRTPPSGHPLPPWVPQGLGGPTPQQGSGGSTLMDRRCS